MIKKVLSTVLICSFIAITFFPSLITANAVDNRTGEENFAFLQKVGVVSQEEIFNKTAKMSRAKFVSMALGLNASLALTFADDYSSSFEDVNRSNPYYNAITTAESLDIISKNPERLFRPDDEITKNEAIKIVCCLLDYGTLAEHMGGFPEGYISVALKIGLLKGMSSNNEYLTENDAVTLINNALNSDALTMTTVDSNGDMSSNITPGETVLLKRFNIKTLKGVLAADCCTDIYSSNPGLDRNQVIINDLIFNSGDSGIEKYVGYNLEVYYKEENNCLNIIYFELFNNDVISAEIENTVFKSDSISYEDSNGKIKDAKVSTATSYIVNGKLVSQSFAAQGEYSNGKIELIDNNGDGIVDVVFISNYSVHIVASVDTITNSVYTLDGKVIELKEDTKDYVFSIEKNGKFVSIDSIKRDDVILLAESYSAGVNKKQLLVSDEKLEAIVEEKSDETITLESVEYDVSEEVYNVVEPGKYYSFKLDYFNCVVEVEFVRDFVYGYLEKICSDGLNSVKCKIFTENNRWVTLELADKIELNDQKKSKNQALDIIKNKSGGYNEIIRYNVNNSGQVKMMSFSEDLSQISLLSDKAQAASDSNLFRKSFDGEMTWRIHSYSFDGKIRLNDDSKIFYIPAENALEDSKIISASRLSANSTITFKAYDVDENLYADIIVVDELALRSIGSGSPFMIVKKIADGLNSKGDTSPVIVGYWNTILVKLPTSLSSVLTETDVRNLAENDIILFNIDDDGNVVSLRNCKSDENGFYGSAYHTSECMAGGKIVKNDIKNESFIIQNGTDTYYISPYDSNTKVMLYDVEEDTCVLTKPNSLVEGDVIIAKLQYFSAKEIVVIRK